MEDVWLFVLVTAVCLTVFLVLECVFCAVFCRKRKKTSDADDVVERQQQNKDSSGRSELRRWLEKDSRRSEATEATTWAEKRRTPPPSPPPQADKERRPSLSTLEAEAEFGRATLASLPFKRPEPTPEERLAEVTRALAKSGEVKFAADLTVTPREVRSVQLHWRARNNHIFPGPGEMTVAAAAAFSSRRGNMWKNTVFEEPKAFDQMFIPGYGNKVVSRNKVRTVICTKDYSGWSGNYIGRCYAIFSDTGGNGHLFFRTSQLTAEKNPTSAGLPHEI